MSAPPSPVSEATPACRVDVWLWAARFFKTRRLSHEAIVGGKVELNGSGCKPARTVKPGDRLRVLRGHERLEVEVLRVSDKRGPASVAQAQLLRQWSSSIIYLPNGTGAPTEDEATALEARGIRVEDGVVDRVIGRDGQLAGVGMADGRIVELDAIFTAPTLVPFDEPLRQLGAERTEQQWGSFATVEPTGQTSVPGVWAAGNVVTPFANVPYAVGVAALAAGSINHELILEDVALAVAAQHRHE